MAWAYVTASVQGGRDAEWAPPFLNGRCGRSNGQRGVGVP